MTYNYTQILTDAMNSEGMNIFTSFLQNVNNALGGLPAILFLLAVWIVTFSFSKEEWESGSIIATFVTTFVSFVFMSIGLVGREIFTLCILVLGILVFVTKVYR